MRDDLLRFYDQELAFLRRMGAEFAEKYPKIAGRLALERNKCEDPHVERLLQGFAFLSARVRLKLEDELPEITDALLGVVYPHYLAPVPSMSLVQFVPDPSRGKLTAGLRVDRGTMLASKPVGGVPCRFRTSYPVTLWPVEITGVELRNAPLGFKLPAGAGEPAAALKISLRPTGPKFLDLAGFNSLRIFFDGPATISHPLYELFHNAVTGVYLRPNVDSPEQKKLRQMLLPASAVRPVGFERDEGLLPYPARSFLGYRLLTEYFTFPDKFLFADLVGLEAAGQAGYSDTLEIWLLLNRGDSALDKVLTTANLRLFCTPAVNLFSQTADPIRVKQTRSEYRIIPDVRRPLGLEIYSVDSVSAVAGRTRETVEFPPFYSFRHSYQREQSRTFHYAVRRPSGWRDDAGTEVFLSLVDLSMTPTIPEHDVLLVQTTCSNRDLPGKLPFTGDLGDFSCESGGPPAGIRCLRKPTASLRVAGGKAAQWRLISHLSLNYLSLTDVEALRELLMLYDFQDLPSTRRQISGLVGLTCEPAVGRTGPGAAAGFCRGLHLTGEFDEEAFVGTGVYLFASVLERFLGLYTSINSFVKFTARSRQREGDIRRWPPRAGEINLL